MSMPDTLLLLVFPALMAFAAVSDLLTMTIPNRVSLLLVAGFLVMAWLTGMDWSVIGLHFAAGGLVLLITFTLFALGWIGGGDAKLAAAVALWCGFSVLLDYLFVASLLGGQLSLAIIYWRSAMLPEFMLKVNWITRLHHTKTGIPYGIALAAAGLMVYPTTAIWTRVAGV
jgi:prepilin peptidase CpaA